MKVGRGAPKRPQCSWCGGYHGGGPENCPTVKPTAGAESSPRLRVGIPGKTYTVPTKPSPTPRRREHVDDAPPPPDGWMDAVVEGGPLGLHGGPSGWQCRYGCAGGMSKVDGVAYHHHACQYWQNEGKHETPF
jgi:hypothetical protein